MTIRYVALGDSQSEGIGDGDETTGYRGWADRFAEQLAATGEPVLYANLAVRGRLAGQIHAEQLGPAVALRPTLATVVAGMNDLIRPNYDAEAVAGHLEAMFAALTAAGATVATVAFPDIGRIAPIAAPLRRRVADLNGRIRNAAARLGVTVVDGDRYEVTSDPRLWCADRLHANPSGHARIAAAVAHGLGIPGSDDSWTRPLPSATGRTGWQSASTELLWLAEFLGPWLVRRLLGKSSGDGRTAKRPSLLPV
ncbi:SGNH/GDSL hydrolase family protein [Amycolatopsis sp. EV170708-02-1]|uniref:SGNH/GDSL hydrolase family protein n=1 Tax=Amycolatopsis sp. EV170708-02-1 TaxID=2919322 RepID=UPI001F0BE5DD|nr:SGNH/GDSL hydrolase family protein [Amycolatopsis sp. EV170708-02-1]UMP00079.1 SGNH/GDSL hydrolase family protein [Amycolatopsis sp. EV170708-02-1]